MESLFTEVWCNGPDGEVICPCGHQFYFDACTEDGLALIGYIDGDKALFLKCPSCGLLDTGK